ncbi:MAG: excinuclease ABC subunit UvrA [Candidatus Yanofskybacteria bacterium]|nr:excinuclease ABC subunit UvrA [Candidatus Yanofskybacteria bacterium]
MHEPVIKIRGARMHNLKNINIDIPKDKLVVITGLSGSGKSSLAFDTLYAEGQRRYVESLSAYARQFLGVMDKPDVDSIEGISPAIAIDQRKGAHNPRSTVGTTTEIYDYLRLLFARIGIPHCPTCGREIKRQSPSQIAEIVAKNPAGTEILIMGPQVRGKKGEWRGTLEEIARAGFVRVRIDGIIYRIEEALEKELDKQKKHFIEVVVDRMKIEKDLDRPRLADSIETALKLGKGLVMVNEELYSERFACEVCGISLPELEPRIFSFNSPHGACPACQGLGERLEVAEERVIPNPKLSLAEGAIFPWARASHKIGRQGYFWWKLENLAKEKKFSVSVPVKDLPKGVLGLILRGSEDFEGVIPWLEQRWRETDSEYARAEIEQYMTETICEQCMGKRLRPEVLAVTVAGMSLDRIADMELSSAKAFFESLETGDKLQDHERKIAQSIVKEIGNRLQFLLDVGLEYLTLGRKATTLSGGEEQRIRLATQIGSKLTGILYILDEPSIGLHARDQSRLVATLKKLRDIGNTVIVVEHDPQTIRAADWVIDIGPGAGKHGGKLTFQGTPKQLLKSSTLTGQYLSGRLQGGVKSKDRKKSRERLLVKGVTEHNLKNIDVKIPLRMFVCVSGVSGSGKSSLVNDVIAKALLKKFFQAKDEPGKHKGMEGIEYLNKVVLVDQAPIGRTPRSNPATYTGAFSSIRDLFCQTKEAKIRGYGPGKFSFNVKGGRCEQCEGQGVKKIEMYFLPDIYVECEECHGTRYTEEVLQVKYKGKSVSEVLSMTTEDALEFFKNIPSLAAKLKTLNDVGLGYVELGQPAPSLSGGEAQRIKLATELSRKATGRTLYILDEPTTGLHPDDVRKLLSVLQELVNKQNTVLVIEHHSEFLKSADWIIDLGPEGGEQGGYIVAEGAPEDIMKEKKSYTGQFLAQG